MIFAKYFSGIFSFSQEMLYALPVAGHDCLS